MAMPPSTPRTQREKNGWARGLVHFHTKFSDGWASVLRAGEIAVRENFDFLIVTDHLKGMKLAQGRTLAEYIAECEAATQRLPIPVIAGGEFEVDWNSGATADFSQAHTLVLSVSALAEAGAFDWTTPDASPYAHWADSNGETGTLLSVQEKLGEHDLLPLASHQFQHSPISMKQGEHADYRYDLNRLPSSRYFDVFYSGAVELIHEPEDLMLYDHHATSEPERQKAVYASCDFHIGPQTTWPPLAGVIDRLGPVRNSYRWLFRKVAATGLRLKGRTGAAVSPYFAEEQLSQATYVHLGEKPWPEARVLDGLREGRTCVTRGKADFVSLLPVPSFTDVYTPPVRLHLELPTSYSESRPRSVIVLRDGKVVHWEPYPIDHPAIEFTWTDTNPPTGVHTYQLYVPSKFLSSPMRFSV